MPEPDQSAGFGVPEVDTKRCGNCQNFLPRDSHNFAVRKRRNRDGTKVYRYYDSNCRDCRAAQERARNASKRKAELQKALQAAVAKAFGLMLADNPELRRFIFARYADELANCKVRKPVLALERFLVTHPKVLAELAYRYSEPLKPYRATQEQAVRKKAEQSYQSRLKGLKNLKPRQQRQEADLPPAYSPWLPNERVAGIRFLHHRHHLPVAVLARLFDVSDHTVRQLVNGTSRAKVEPIDLRTIRLPAKLYPPSELDIKRLRWLRDNCHISSLALIRIFLVDPQTLEAILKKRVLPELPGLDLMWRRPSLSGEQQRQIYELYIGQQLNQYELATRFGVTQSKVSAVVNRFKRQDLLDGKITPDFFKWRGRGKLSEDQVRSIRQLSGDGLSYSQLAQRFNTSSTTIGKIVRGETWAHVI